MCVKGTYREEKWSWDVDEMSYIDIIKLVANM